MKFEKIPEDIVCFISLSAEVFDTLPESAQQALVQAATAARDAVQAQKVAQEKADYERQKADEERKKADEERQLRERVERWNKVMGTPHELTPVLSELSPTRSENIIMSSKEFLDFRASLESDFLSGRISSDELTRLVHEFIDLKKREGDIRRKHERKDISRKLIAQQIQEKISKHTHVGHIGKKFYVDDLYDDETWIDEGFEVPVRVPVQDYIETEAHNMLEEFQARNKILHPIFVVSVNAFFTASHRHPSYTHNVVISDMHGNLIEGWYQRFLGEVFDKVRTYLSKEEYEMDTEEDVFNPSITINLNVYEIRTARSWWPDGVEKYLQLDDFVIFTANDENVDCKKQCVEHLGFPYNPSKSLIENFRGRPVIVYQPLHLQMSQVRGFKDLMTTTIEEVPSTDCRRVIRLIVDGDHCAVIDSILQPNRPRTKIVRKRFHAPDNDKAIEVFYDIETFRDEETNYAVPYLICWSDDKSDEVRQVFGENAVMQFVDRILNDYDGEEVVLMAWNGSGFDHQLIIGELKNRGGTDEVYLKENNLIYARIELKDTLIHLKDPMKFIPRKLAAAAESFGVLNKGEFPHEIVKSFEDLDVVYKDWFILRSEIVTESYGDHDKVKIISSVLYKQIIENNNTNSVLEKAIQYCTIDVLCCKQIWMKFKDIIWNEFQIRIRPSMMTLPQLAIDLIQTLLSKNVELYIPITRDDYDFFMKAQYGGRVVAKTGIYKEQCLVLDVVSEYPTVMHDYLHPYGGYFEVTYINWNKLGIYHVILDGTSMTTEQIQNYSEFVPFRDDDGLHYEFRTIHEGVYCTYDLLIAKEEGYEIKCIKGFEWESKGYVFRKFIQVAKTLKEKGKGAVKFTGKILLNSGFGKMGQKPIDDIIYIVKKGIAQQIIDRMDKADDKFVLGGLIVTKPTFTELDDKWDKMIIKMEGDVRYPTQNSIFILAAARHFLRGKMLNIKQHAPNLKVIYSDTDSLIIPISSLDGYDISPHLGKEFGQLSDEIDGEHGIRPYEVIIAGRKMYAFYYNDKNGFPKQMMRLKGVPAHLHNAEDLKFILKDVDNSIRYKMMTMRRNITNIKTLDVVKKITQTGIFVTTNTKELLKADIDPASPTH